MTTDKPNIVVFLWDNFGWGELGCCGGGILRGAPTPRMAHPIVAAGAAFLKTLAAEPADQDGDSRPVHTTQTRRASASGAHPARPIIQNVLSLVKTDGVADPEHGIAYHSG
jgi:hypothetical protein